MRILQLLSAAAEAQHLFKSIQPADDMLARPEDVNVVPQEQVI